MARFGDLSGRDAKFRSWWPEEICRKIEKIVGLVYSPGELGEDWHEFTACDGRRTVLGTHRTEGY